jgi:hypothetical protein
MGIFHKVDCDAVLEQDAACPSEENLWVAFPDMQTGDGYSAPCAEMFGGDGWEAVGLEPQSDDTEDWAEAKSSAGWWYTDGGIACSDEHKALLKAAYFRGSQREGAVA